MSTNINTGSTLHLEINSNGTGTLSNSPNSPEIEQVQITCNNFTGTGEIKVYANNQQCGTITQSGQSVSVQKGSNIKLLAIGTGNNMFFVSWGSNFASINAHLNECTINDIQNDVTINPVFVSYESVCITINSFSNGIIIISGSKRFDNNYRYDFVTQINPDNEESFPLELYIPKGSDITLEEIAGQNNMFVSWGTNDVTVHQDPTKYTIDDIQNDVTISPIFDEYIYIETSSFSHGNITISAQKTITANDYRFETTINQNDTFPFKFYIPKGSNVILKANPDPDNGYTFTGWGYNNQTDASCDIGQLNASICITPVFEQTNQEYCSITINGLSFGYTIGATNESGTINYTFSEENNSYSFVKNSKIIFSPTRNDRYVFERFSNNEIIDNNNEIYVILNKNIVTNFTFNIKLRISEWPDNLWAVNLLDGPTNSAAIIGTFNNDNEEISFTVNPSHNYVFQLNEPDNSNYYCTNKTDIDGKSLVDIIALLNLVDYNNNIVKLNFERKVTGGEQKHYRFKLKYKGSDKSIFIDWKPIVYNLNKGTNHD